MPPLLDQVREALATRYRVDSEIGSGGMGTVFLAEDLRHGRKVAIKVLSPELGDRIALQRFIREIETGARLTHPHILPLHDSGEAAGLPYFVMPYVGQSSLRDLLRKRGPLSVEDASALLSEVADALDYAHRAGVVHRDIKPENILLEEGHAVISDFGVARAADAAGVETLTGTGHGVGTPHYMSPEQVSGHGPVDGRADVYALGCMAYEMLAGEPPFTGPTARAVVSRKLAGEIPSLRVVRRAVPLAVEEAVRKALAPAPADRFETAGEFVRALEPDVVPRRSARRKIVWSAVLGVAVVLLAGALYTTLFPGGDPDPGDVVVVPMADPVGMPGFDGLGSRVAQQIAQSLTQTGTVEVVPFASAERAFQRLQTDNGTAAVDPVRMGTETGAGTVVLASLPTRGPDLGISVSLVDVRTGRLVGGVERFGSPDAFPEVGAEVRSRTMSMVAAHLDERVPPSFETAGRSPTWDAYRHFEDGLTLYTRNQFEESLDRFLAAYAEDTTFVEALLYASVNQTNLGRFEAADSLLGVVGGARDRLSDYDRAFLHYREAVVAGDPLAALDAVRRAATLAPGAKVVYNHAVAAFETRRLAEAFEALSSLEPETGPMEGFVPYWDLLASLHHLRGDHEDELAVVRRARASHVDRLWVQGLEVNARAALGQAGEVADLLAAMSGLSTDDYALGEPLRVLHDGGRELAAHGRPGAAEEAFRLALGRLEDLGADTLPVPHRIRRAHLLYDLGRWEEAGAAARALRDLGREDVEVLGLIGRVAARQDHRRVALAVSDSLAAAEERFPPYGRLTRERAYIASALGDLDRAAELLEDAFDQGLPFGNWLHQHPDVYALRELEAYRRLTRPIER